MRILAVGAGLALVAALGAGCGGGGGGGAPGDASEEDFCKTYNSITEGMNLEEVPSDKEVIARMKEWGEEMEEVGTPEGMPEEAREGFEVMISALEKLDDDATQEELQKLGDDFSNEDQKAGEAFGEYVAETCPSNLPDLELPAESP